MSIATKTGDRGKTKLIGGQTVSKADLRVEAYGTLDELVSIMGFARSICEHEPIVAATKSIQRELFQVSASLATPSEPDSATGELERAVTQDMVDRLTEQVESIESIEGILGDWILPGENKVSAAYDMARTCCRRAERAAVRLRDSGEPVDSRVIVYINRLSDLLWLFGRLIELDAGVDAKLRESGEGASWSRAW